MDFKRRKTAQNAHAEATPCARNGRPRNTADAPVEYDDEHSIEHDVADGRRDQKPQRRFAVAERREHTGRNVVDKKEQKPPNVNSKVQRRIFHNVLRRAEHA